MKRQSIRGSINPRRTNGTDGSAYRRGAVGSAVLLALALNAAHAQQGSGVLEEVVVTAQFREQGLQDTPLAITAISGEAMRARTQSTLLDVSAQAPSVVMQPSPQGFGNSAQIAIRGIGQDDFNMALEPGVGIYVDDVYYSTLFGAVLDLLDLERVEILRGPQGTLAGRNSIGGAVRMVSRMPDGTGESVVDVTVGTDERLELRGSTEFTLVPDKLFMRVAGSSKKQEGYMYRLDYGCAHPESGFPAATPEVDCVLGTEGGIDSDAGRVILSWLPSDRVDVSFAADVYRANDEPQANTLLYVEEDPGVTYGGLVYGPTFLTDSPFTNYTTYGVPERGMAFEPRNTVDAFGLSGKVEWQMTDNLSLTSITAFRQQTGGFTQDSDGSPLGESMVFQSVEQEQFSQEVRFNHAPSDRFEYTAGLYYFDAEGHLGGRLTSGLLDFLIDDDIPASNRSAFIHTSTSLTDRMNLTVGARYSDEEKSYTFQRSNPNGGPVLLIEGIVGKSISYDEQRTDYRVALDYAFADNLLGYAQVSTGFRGGGVNPRPFYTNQLVPFGQEELETFEIGLKSDLLDRHLRLNVALYRNDYSDIQVETTTPYFNPALPVQPDPELPSYNPIEGTVPSGVILNAGDAESQGIEIELTYNLDRLSIDASYSYLDFEYTGLSPDALASGIGMDMVTPFTPEHTASVGLQYDFPLAGGGFVTTRLDGIHRSEVYNEPTNAYFNHLESRTIYNARVSYLSRSGDWETSVAVLNLTDEIFYHSIFGRGADRASGMPDRGRQWLVSLRRSF